MIRSWIKAGAAHLLCQTSMDKVVGSLLGGRRTPLVIGYHRVVEDFASAAQTSIPSMLVSRKMLERHLDWIGRRYRFVDLNELGALLESGRPVEERIAAITFDDGYRDFYDHALPSLQKKGVPAALFVVTGLIGTTTAHIHDQLYYLLTKCNGHARFMTGLESPDITGMRPYQAMRTLIESIPASELQQVIRTLQSTGMIPEHSYDHAVSWEMLDRIHRAGVVIGSHTKNHIVMTNETRECVLEEAVGSRLELERRLGAPVRHFAYPSGSFDSVSVKAVSAAGYRFGYTSCAHRSMEHPLLTIPRTLLWEEACLDSNRAFSESIMSCQVHRVFDLVAGCRQQHAMASGTVCQEYGNGTF